MCHCCKDVNADQTFGKFSLAQMYEQGLGTERNIKEAMRWYKSAAELGHVKSQQHLESMYVDS